MNVKLKSKFNVGDVVVRTPGEKYYAKITRVNEDNLELVLVEKYGNLRIGYTWLMNIDVCNDGLQFLFDASKMSKKDIYSAMKILDI